MRVSERSTYSIYVLCFFASKNNMKNNNKKEISERKVVQHYDKLGIPQGFVPEQERNFDAGYIPSNNSRIYVRKEWIDGKLYKVWQ